MKKSISTRFFLAYIISIGIGFFIIGFAFMSSLEDHIMSNKEEIMINQAIKIEKEYEAAYKTGIVDLDKINEEIRILKNYSGGSIWLISRNGNIYIDSDDAKKYTKANILTTDEVKTVFSGKILKKRGYFKEFFDEPVISIGYPIKIDGDVIMAIFIHASIPEVRSSIEEISEIGIWSLMVAAFIGFVIVFFISQDLIKRIRELNDGVKVIAKGKFEKRLENLPQDEIGELGRNFNLMAEELEGIDAMRRCFVSNLSHDLRSPLTSIKGFVKAILEGTISEDDSEKYLKIVLSESERLSKLTNDILDLSKMESGQYKLDINYFRTNDLIISELDKIEQKALEKGVEIRVEIGENHMVKGDINEMTRVLQNLLDNALKFSNSGGFIKVSTYQMEDGRIRVSVSNSGSYIEENDIKRIWERFYKADESRGKDKKGSGLGLSIAHQIVRSHGEYIGAESSEEQGTVFWFTLSM